MNKQKNTVQAISNLIQLKNLISLRAMLKRFAFFAGLILLITLASCNKYNQLLKSTDYEKKYEAAIKYYEEKNYLKAYPLLEEMVTVTRGSEKAEKVYYYYASCNFYLEDYELAGFHFKNFVKTYPGSKYAEEAMFLSAYTFYLTSSEPSLDQTYTYKAITELQLFINKYPGTEKAEEATKLIDTLREKLEVKTYNICKQYFKTENYKSTIVCVENALRDFPGSKFNEELSFLSVKANYLYAIHSVETKKPERLKSTLDAAKSFIMLYPESEFKKEAQQIKEISTKVLNKQS
jgi:outer membrane protein assembly factor BamD